MSQTIDPTAGSFRARWASIAIRENLAAIQKEILSLPNDVNRNKLVGVKGTLYQDSSNQSKQPLKVGIVGAGCAGLFTALIFDNLKAKCGLEVDYEILEANGEDRLGGRLYSYFFRDKDGQALGPHDYFDVGAMRFPKIDIMKRTFYLFTKVCHMQESSKDPQKGGLIEYYLQPDPEKPEAYTPTLYNDEQFKFKREGKRPTAKDFAITGLRANEETETADSLIDKKIKIFTDAFHKDPTEGWKLLMELGDKYSVRQFLGDAYNYNTLEWLETYSYGNRWYDQALSEMILEDLDFNHKGDWRCVEGGAQEVAYRMRAAIQKKEECIFFKKTVTAMKLVDEDGPDGKPDGKPEAVDVFVRGEEKSRQYDAVFNSAPLGAMQKMNLSGLNLNWGTKQAIRSLGYGASCKVGIRFKNLWWIKMGIFGGVAKTDLPIRVCVYPSCNMTDDAEKPSVLLCSYTWSQEAQRIGSLINRKSPHEEEELRDLLIDNLARLHAKKNDPADLKRIQDIITKSYDTHFAYDWFADPTTSGAFAYFGPAQFRNMYPWVTRTHGKHIIMGEAASAHHAWVFGALESAVRGVYQFLFKHSEHSKAVDDALQMYNNNTVESPFGPLPLEYDRAEDVKWMTENGREGNAQVATSIGELAREQVAFETIRIKQGGDQLRGEYVTSAQLAKFIQATA